MLNVSNIESSLRMIIAFALIIFQIKFLESEIYQIIGISVAMIIFYTGVSKSCFIYTMFDFKGFFNNYNYSISLLPKNRASPAFVFDSKAKEVFKNKSSKKYSITKKFLLEFFNLENTLENFINESKLDEMTYEDSNKKTFKIDFVGLNKEKLLLCYFTDITEIIELNKEMENTQKEIIYSMGQIGESRSKETGNHVKRVALYSSLLAELYGLNKKEVKEIKLASPMHDIGKVGIPDDILNAPRKLNKEEWKIMQTHASIGYDMLKSSKKPIILAASIIAHEHHEKWDGTGYPRGLKKEEIHIYGRITSLADVFDALVSKRCYKDSWDINEAKNFIIDNSGSMFDPKLVQLFIENFNKFEAIGKKYT